MTQVFRSPARVLATLILLGSGALTLSGCGDSPSFSLPTAPPTVSPTEPAAIDMVVEQVVSTYWAADSTTDEQPADAHLRARDWFTATGAESLVTDLPGGAGGADWITLAAHDGHYVVTSVDATEAMPDLPPDTLTTTSRARVVTLTPTGADDWVGDPLTVVARLDLVYSAADGWLVNSLTSEIPIGLTDEVEGE